MYASAWIQPAYYQGRQMPGVAKGGQDSRICPCRPRGALADLDAILSRICPTAFSSLYGSLPPTVRTLIAIGMVRRLVQHQTWFGVLCHWHVAVNIVALLQAEACYRCAVVARFQSGIFDRMHDTRRFNQSIMEDSIFPRLCTKTRHKYGFDLVSIVLCLNSHSRHYGGPGAPLLAHAVCQKWLQGKTKHGDSTI